MVSRPAISEQEPLGIPGWHHWESIRTKHPEWLTCSLPPLSTVCGEQLSLEVA